MLTALAILLIAHGLIHLLGFAKAFGLAELPQLSQPISPTFGLLWLLAAVLFVGAGIAALVWARGWWAIAACALVISMFAIVPSWSVAKLGAFVNLSVLVAVALGFVAHGPFSLRATYERDVERGLSGALVAELVTEADLAHLPPPVERYLRQAGVVGRPRVKNFRARVHGRIRGGPNDRWIPLVAEQHNVVGLPARLFYFNASIFAVPVQGYHRYVGSGATMRVNVAALVPVFAASGVEMTQSETVTLFNDMCLMAPATLIDRAIYWDAIDSRTARARFTNAGHTIHAELTFADSGELMNFVSDDRYQLSPDGTSMRRLRWSTPVSAHRMFRGVRLPAGGSGHWHATAGEYSYIELTIDDVEYNVRPGPRQIWPSKATV